VKVFFPVVFFCLSLGLASHETLASIA